MRAGATKDPTHLGEDLCLRRPMHDKKFSGGASHSPSRPAMSVARSYLASPPARRPMASLLRSSRWQ
jgi:hypothetical protein